MSPPIKPNILFNLMELFNKKKWETSLGTTSNLSLFQKFCDRLKLFTIEEQKLIIEITDKFIRVGLKEYLERFYESLICLGDPVFEKYERIYIYPLIDPYILNNKRISKIPRGKIKSASFLHYMIDSDDWTWLSKKLIVSTSIKELVKNFDATDSCLILIDDFVGTGNTAINVCKVYLKEDFLNGNISPDNIKVVSIAAQKNGIKNVKDTLNIDVIANIIVPKGISDFYHGKELADKILSMEEIERKLEIGNDYCFGFGRSEALITFLNKTPNNTFPVYWEETKSKVAPFPRYKKYDLYG